jgi:hypothetical protein
MIYRVIRCKRDQTHNSARFEMMRPARLKVLIQQDTRDTTYKVALSAKLLDPTDLWTILPTNIAYRITIALKTTSDRKM